MLLGQFRDGCSQTAAGGLLKPEIRFASKHTHATGDSERPF